MNKKQLVAKLAGSLNQSKADAERTFDTITNTILDALKNDDSVKIAGFGTYKVAKRKARIGRNPRTGEQIQVAEIGFIPFLSIMAYISISLGLINLFPIPLLDGGHLMFYGFEKILGRPLSQKTQEGFFRIGMFLLLFLMFFATFNDLKDLGLF